MHDALKNHLIQRLGTDTANMDKVLAHFKPLSVKRNELLLIEGSVCRYVYFVVSGCLQVFVQDDAGDENTRDLVVENNWCAELISFGTQKPATENIRTVEHSELLTIDFQNFQILMKDVPQFDKVYKQILEQSYANSVYRINTFMTLSSLERIKWLMTYRPALMTRLPAKLIASYLGINKDVFSRLRSRV